LTVPAWVWLVTIGGLLAMFALDLFMVARNPRVVTVREAGMWTFFYVGLAIAFGLGMWGVVGSGPAGEFFAGWLTEYSLSVDNLFIFVIIMSRFAVPRAYQQTVLMVGILLALVMRGIFIALGAAAITRFSWVFYLFGIFLIYTAYKLAKGNNDEEEEFSENAALRLVRRVLPTTREYAGTRLVTRVEGRRLFTPMLIVMVAIGTTDLLFALDSIPAIFGLTQEPYIVFTANAFALMGLRQLFFLLGGLLDRLVYLAVGLSVILGFIGVKLILEALHTNDLPFLNGGEHVSWAPEIPIWLSLGVILITLAITTVASLLRTRADERQSLSS
jgi:tellurite resistance protein TerC